MPNISLLEQAYDFRQKGKLKDAAETFRKAAENADNVIEKAGILLNLADTLTELGESNLASNQLRSARELLSIGKSEHLSPSEEIELKRLVMGVEVQDADILRADGQFQNALEKLQDLVRRYRDDPQLVEEFDVLRMQQAFLLCGVGRYEEALPILQDLASKHPRNGAVLFHLGHSYVTLKDFASSKPILEEALSIELPEGFEFQAHCSLGMALYGLQDYSAAKREFEIGSKTATPHYLKDAHIWRWLECTCEALGQAEEAHYYSLLTKSRQ